MPGGSTSATGERRAGEGGLAVATTVAGPAAGSGGAAAGAATAGTAAVGTIPVGWEDSAAAGVALGARGWPHVG